MSLSAKMTRNRQRAFHLVASAILVAYIYWPWGGDQWFRLLVQCGVVPLVAISGLWMWRGHQLVSWLKSERSRRPAPAANAAAVADSAAD